MINLSIPLLGVGMAIGGIAWEYRKYYEAQMGLLTGVSVSTLLIHHAAYRIKRVIRE